MLIGITTQRPVRFMAKAPLFKGRVLGALLRSVGMIPAYRASDDKSSVRRNVESLSVAAENLAKGLPMGIFPEGKSHDLTHVEQVKTGAARIAQQAVALAEGKPVWVVPLGINYEEKPRFRSRVWVAVGETVDATAWFAEHEGNEKQAMRQLTIALDERLKAVVVHLGRCPVGAAAGRPRVACTGVRQRRQGARRVARAAAEKHRRGDQLL